MQLESFVPAMGSDTGRYEYELADNVTLHRQPPMPVPELPGKTTEEVLNAAYGAFPKAYRDLASASFKAVNDQPWPESVTLFIAEAKLKTLGPEVLKTRACAAKTALGYSCDCETVETEAPLQMQWLAWPDKRVVPLILHFGLGC
jgi:hypothetical protein